MARVLGIDLGAWTVKVAVFEGSFGRYKPAEVFARRVVAEPGELPGLEPRLAALRTLVEEEELQGFGVVATSWPVDRTSMRVVDLPFDDRAKVARILPFEVENYVPFEVEDMVLEHRVLSRDEGSSRVLACLADRDEVEAVLEGLRAMGLDPRHLVLDADIHSAWSGAEEGVQAVLDIGYSRALMGLLVGGVMYDARSVLFGARQLDRRLCRTFGLDPDAAEAYRRAATLEPTPDTAVPVDVGWDGEERTVATGGEDDLRLAQKGGPPDPSAVARLLREGMLELVADIRTSLIAFEDRHGVDIDEVLLTGGLSGTRGLATLLSHELGVPVRLVPIAEPARGLDGEAGFALASAVGTRAAGLLRGKPLELRQGDLAHHSGLQVLRNLASYGAAAAVFFVLAMIVVVFVERGQLNAEISGIEDQIAEVVGETFPETSAKVLEDPSMAVAIMQEETLSTAQEVELLQGSIRGDPPALTLMRDISNAMPKPEDATIDVKELVLGETAVTIEASTDGFEAAATIEASLQKQARFQAATKGDEKKRGDKVQFTISIPLGVEDDEEAEG